MSRLIKIASGTYTTQIPYTFRGEHIARIVRSMKIPTLYMQSCSMRHYTQEAHTAARRTVDDKTVLFVPNVLNDSLESETEILDLSTMSDIEQLHEFYNKNIKYIGSQPQSFPERLGYACGLLIFGAAIAPKGVKFVCTNNAIL